MFKLSKDPNQVNIQKAEAAITELAETLKVHSKMCELNITNLLKKLKL